MLVPSDKNPAIENFLEDLAGRSSSITEGLCVKPPYGCGKPITEFRDERSAKEYTISGLCQSCQDEIWK
jgi:hypothetical protein